MKILLMSMPDVAPIIFHESAIHMPNLGIASVGGNIDAGHEVYIVDLIRKRGRVARYIRRTLQKIQPDLVGLSSMAWQYDTCVKIIRLVKALMPDVKIVIGGYHATLMAEEVAASPEAELIDFIVRNEGEETCRRLVNALDGGDRLADIPSLSYKEDGRFVHNPQGDLLDLSRLKLPIRDKRRLTWGYHIMNNKIEVLETSRGCTRNCHFCSIRHMYGRSFRTYPIERVLEDLDVIYHFRDTRWAFVTDDNLVLDPEHVDRLCEGIIGKEYKNFHLVIQADCPSLARNEAMVKKMARAGVNTVFLGIENVSQKNLTSVSKGTTAEISRQAVENCHKHGIMVVGGLVLGFPDDDEIDLIQNFEYFRDIGIDGLYCQLLTPYPKTRIREDLLDEGLVVNPHDFRWYNGMWANVRTRHLDADRLQYLMWHHKLKIMGWWDPSRVSQRAGKVYTAIWRFGFKQTVRYMIERKIRKVGYEGMYRAEMDRLALINRFDDLEAERPGSSPACQ